MADRHSKETRSYNMSRIRSKDTGPEVFVRKQLHKKGFRYRLHVKNLPGRPDIVLPKYRTAVFIHGCFWHGHEGCKYFRLPATNQEYWTPKIARNKEKDIQSYKALHEAEWKVIEVWECDLRPKLAEQTITLIVEKLKAFQAAA